MVWFDVTTIYHTQDQHVNNYTNEMVENIHFTSNQKLISSRSDITGKNADFVLSNNQSLHPVLYQYG
jgi:hypothetical protein